MKIVCAFDSFKGCMTASEACRAAADGVRLALSDGIEEAEIVCLPMSDGGEGMVECIAHAVNARMVSVMVHNPLMELIETKYAVSLNGETAYMEMAAASGLTLVPKHKRNPMITTTYGVGEMILDAVARGCKRIVMGIGGSATCDGGRGMIECLEGHLPLHTNGTDNEAVEIIVASDVANPLYGKNGAAYIFAPQKGATPEQVKLLDKSLREFAHETETKGIALPDLAEHPGTGAAGGLGYGLMAYLDAKLQSGIDLMLDTIGFDKRIKGADCIITGEGKSDKQTLMGKVPEGILRRASKQNIPVHLVSGAIENKDELLRAGFSSVCSINEDDHRPLDTLMQREVAMSNMKNQISFVTLRHDFKHYY